MFDDTNRRAALTVLFSAALAACGGGDGAPAPAPTEPPAPAPPPAPTPPPAPAASILLRTRLTAAGTGALDGKGTQAYFDHPLGIAADAAGNFYVADLNNATVRKITPDGTATTMAGKVADAVTIDGPAGVARLRYPEDVAVTTDGTVYVTDAGLLRRVAADGAISTVGGVSQVAAMATAPGGGLYLAGRSAVYAWSQAAGLRLLAGLDGFSGDTDGTASDARFSVFGDLAVDTAGNIYASQPDRHTVRRITPAGVVTTIGSPGQFQTVNATGAEARFNVPFALAADPAGNVWVVQQMFGQLRRIAPDGAVTTPYDELGVQGGNHYPRIAFKGTELYVTHQRGVGRVLGREGVAVLAGQAFATTVNPQQELRRVAVDAAGNSVVLTGNRVSKYAAGGQQLPFGTSEGLVVPAKVAAVSRVWQGIGTDAEGNIYLSDVEHEAIFVNVFLPRGGAVYRISPAAQITQIGAWPANSIGALAPGALTVGWDGAIYFVDLMTGDLVRWAPGTTAGGTATVLATYQAYAGETYAPSLFAGPPWSLAADAAGVLYVLHKKTLSKVANGTVQVLAGPSQFVAPPYAARLVPITADAAGNVYVGDGEVIVRVSPGGAVAAVAGQRGMIGLRTGALPGSLGVLSSLAAGRDGLLHMMSADDVVTVQLP